MVKEVVERFLKYVKVDTRSKEDIDLIPSTKTQFDLAHLLKEELEDLGIKDGKVTDQCVVIAKLLSNLSKEETEKVPIIYFNAHMDTSPAEPGHNVNPQITKYMGGNLVINKESNLIITPEELPQLNSYIGTEIIHTDGTTLLGADDKAGIAEIMTAIAELIRNPEKKHGDIIILFTPDEEVGKGADAIDIRTIGAKFGYTIDGGEMGGFETECFNAASGTITIKGYNVHPGSAYGKMVNSLRILSDVLQIFPEDKAPETTKDFEYYYHPDEVKGDVNETNLDFIIRNFDASGLDDQISYIQEQVHRIQEKYPKAIITATIKKSYRNMKEKVDQYPEIIEIATKAIKKTGLEVRNDPIRGGTDGARFSFDGVPTPNIFTGGFNYHSKKEFVTVIGMEKAVETILNIIELTTETNLKSI